MDLDTSFLFSGTSFNKKKFPADFARFQTKQADPVEIPENLNDLKSYNGLENVAISKRKRKRNDDKVSVEGFDVFKSSESSLPIEKEKKNENRGLEERKKEINKQIERDAILRKKYNIHIAGSNVPCPLHNFSDLHNKYGCRKKLLKTWAELGFKEPTPIQRQAIPTLLCGRECFASAPTGSGKTFAFVCPLLMKLKPSPNESVKAVIISPTRELASQTARECKRMASGSKLGIKFMTKQMSKNSDLTKRPCHILISTPYRMQLSIQNKLVDLSRVEYLVLDESDKLFEPSLLEQIDSVVKACSNPSLVRALFSATLPDYVEDQARTIMQDAVRIIVGRKNTASETIKQRLVFAGSEEGKLMALRQSFKTSLNPPVLIFVQSKERAKQLNGELKYDGVRVGVIHSDLSESEREEAVDDFRSGKAWVLIATDVVARGMDFKGVKCVINYDFPDSAAAYIHRVGRSGRAGRDGEAVTFYTEDDIPFLHSIANVIATSGCHVPQWIMNLPKNRWKNHRPHRDLISTNPFL